MSHSVAASRRPGTSLWLQAGALLLAGGALMSFSPVPLAVELTALLAGVGAWGLLALRRRRAAAPGEAQDSMSAQERWASHRAALYQIGDNMVIDAVRTGEPMSVVVFEQVDLPELRDIFGAAAARAVVADFTAKLKALAGTRGLAVRADATTWAVLLPGHDDQSTVAAVKQAMGASLAAESDAADEEILLVPRIAMHTVGQRVAPMRSIYREMREKIQQAHSSELMRQEYLRRERERHSRTASLHAVIATEPAALAG